MDRSSHPAASAPRGGAWEGVRAFLKVGACRYIPFYALPFLVGLASTGHLSELWVLFAVVYWGLLSFGTELLNRLSDREEDRINRPGRTALCEVVGYDRLRRITVGLWLALGLASVLWLVLRPNLFLALLVVLGVLSAINYSVGVRFKTKRLLCQVILTFPFFGTFLLGWSTYKPVHLDPAALRELWTVVSPFVVVVGLFIATLVGAKDLTDTEGDRRVGYDSFFVWLRESHGLKAVMGTLMIPYLVDLLYVGTGTLPPRYLGLLAFLPLSLVFAAAVADAREGAEQEAVKELLYQLWFTFVAFGLVLYHPAAETWAAVGVSALYWGATTQRLHWSGGVRRWKVEALARLLARALHGGGRALAPALGEGREGL